METDGAAVDEARFPGRQGRLLFAYLVAEQGRAVPRDELAEVLWGDAPPPTWDKALTVVVSKLRGLLANGGGNGAATVEILAPPSEPIGNASRSLSLPYWKTAKSP